MPEAVSTRRRRLRHLRSSLILAAALFLLLWGADTLSRTGAETLVGRDVQGATGAEAPPDVVVQGRVFLPQVIRGAYTEVDVTTTGLRSGPLRIDRVDSRLTDVHVPFHDVLVQDVRSIGIGQSTQQVTLRYDDLNSYLAATGRPLTISPTEAGNIVEIVGLATVLTQKVEVRSQVQVSVLDGSLRLTPQTIDTGETNLSSAALALLGQRLTLTVPMGTLPFGHELTAVTAGPGSISVQAQGSGIVVQP